MVMIEAINIIKWDICSFVCKLNKIKWNINNFISKNVTVSIINAFVTSDKEQSSGLYFICNGK